MTAQPSATLPQLQTTTTDPAALASVDNGASPGGDASFTYATATGTTLSVSPTRASNRTTGAPPDDHAITGEPPVGNHISVSTPLAPSSPNHNTTAPDNPVLPSKVVTGRKKRRNRRPKSDANITTPPGLAGTDKAIYLPQTKFLGTMRVEVRWTPRLDLQDVRTPRSNSFLFQ